jgi:hypothetical protein
MARPKDKGPITGLKDEVVTKIVNQLYDCEKVEVVALTNNISESKTKRILAELKKIESEYLTTCPEAVEKKFAEYHKLVPVTEIVVTHVDIQKNQVQDQIKELKLQISYLQDQIKELEKQL